MTKNLSISDVIKPTFDNLVTFDLQFTGTSPMGLLKAVLDDSDSSGVYIVLSESFFTTSDISIYMEKREKLLGRVILALLEQVEELTIEARS